ncbi:LOW QUALITY PROTEIN: hypothetical protein Smp_133590 [Schistosoma mansoni]|uniref:hypothetical protein n=1 Tax=Schistosoma mansoni TaxID=6183 RepID=UPI00022DC346|nr:LOW QUALITY PROTEIN: hypothetical protein Smp_133590 [Schistosoma mansoni]|eukprot:XP_018650565.1 LOW QUALITY PROTEIN: hypothetical protein Smp_133590 [Schistosoma mansoni]
MPGTVKVRVISARNLPVMDRATFLTDAFVELCIGSITYKTEVVRRSLNPSWNSEWFCFELDDRALQDEALLLKVMDHDTYSAHDTIGRVYFDLNPLLSRGQTRCLNGWFPIYDTMHGIRGEICLAIRVDVFLDASRYHQSSLGVRFYHYSLIGFIQELVMNDDPEHQWIEKIRTSRASNEARQRLFSRLSGELQRKMGLKVLNIGGNSLIGYQLHFDLEGETGVVVRGIGTAVRLKKYSPEFPFLTISQPLPGMILHFGSLIASKSVRLLDKNSPAGIQFRDAWWLELRTEIVAHMRSIGCDAVLAYREECTIYEDVCILQSYGTAVQINPKWINNLSYKITNTNSLGRISVTLAKATSNYFATIDRCTSKKPCTRSCSPDFTSARHSLHISSSETTPVPSPTSSYNKESYKEETTPDKCLPHKKIFHDINNSVKPNCHICHLPSTSDTNPNRFTSPVTSSRCAICKAANVPDLLFSSSDFPPELVIIGNPALVQARVCRSKKDTKGEVAASELSEILPFIDYELHYRLMQKLRLRNMNGLFGLRYRIAVGEYMIAAIALVLVYTLVLYRHLHLLELFRLYRVLTTTESIPISNDNSIINDNDNSTLNNSKVFIHSSIPVSMNSNEVFNWNYQSNSFIRVHETELTVPDSFFETSIYSTNYNTTPVFTPTYYKESNHLLNTTIVTSLSATTTSIVKTKQHNTLHCINGNSLGKALREFNQLTWFRFRHYIPCIINALDYRLSFTDDEHIQSLFIFIDIFVMKIIATGMILHPTNSSITRNDEKQHTMFNAQSNDSSSSTSNNNNHNSNSVGNFDVDDDDNANGRKASIKNRSKFHLHKPTLLSRLKSDLKSRSLGKRTTDGMMINNDDIPTEQKQCKQQFIDKQHISGCILTPLSSIPNTYVEAYLGNLDFFFVRETTDLREVGGISGFLHTSLAEVQAVVGAHTTSLGGNALLSYHLSEVVVLRPTSRNQAQCLLNVCGDMARISWEITK